MEKSLLVIPHTMKRKQQNCFHDNANHQISIQQPDSFSYQCITSTAWCAISLNVLYAYWRIKQCTADPCNGVSDGMYQISLLYSSHIHKYDALTQAQAMRSLSVGISESTVHALCPVTPFTLSYVSNCKCRLGWVTNEEEIGFHLLRAQM